MDCLDIVSSAGDARRWCRSEQAWRQVGLVKVGPGWPETMLAQVACAKQRNPIQTIAFMTTALIVLLRVRRFSGRRDGFMRAMF